MPGDLSPRLTIATWGRIIPDHETDSMLIELHDGEIHERPDKEAPDKYQVIRFGQHNLYVQNVERDFQASGRQTRGDREMNLKDLWAAAAQEQNRQDKVQANVTGLAETMLKWQWKLLNTEQRSEVLGNRPAPPEGPDRDNFLEGKFRATLIKVDRVAEQSMYQEKIKDSYRVKENRYLVEFHKKFAIPFACLVFALIGVPMAVTSSRSGKGISVSLAIAVYLVYYLFLVGGEKFADRGRLDPFLAMWAANFFLLALGIPLFIKSARESKWFNFKLKSRKTNAGDSVTGVSP